MVRAGEYFPRPDGRAGVVGDRPQEGVGIQQMPSFPEQILDLFRQRIIEIVRNGEISLGGTENRRFGCSSSGTSFATGFPALAITTSSPNATRSKSLERWVFASWILTSMIRHNSLSPELSQSRHGSPYSNWSITISGFDPNLSGGPQVPAPLEVNTCIFPMRLNPYTNCRYILRANQLHGMNCPRCVCPDNCRETPAASASCRMVGRMDQQEYWPDRDPDRTPLQHRRQMPLLRRIPIRHTDNLQPIDFYFLVVEHAHTRRGNGPQIFAVVAELLVISRDEINPLRCRKFIQRLGSPPRINGSAVIQIPGNKNRVRLFPQNLRHHPPQKIRHFARAPDADR